MAFEPQTNIKLLKVPIEIDNKNQLTFENKEKQFEYFNNLPCLEIDNCSYQRKDSIIKYPEHIDKLLQYNYCMYQNENYSDKWFYCFITNMKYTNQGMTEISITTDVFQTWQFDLNFKQSFIEREMIDVEKDIPGANLIPEGFETGEYKIGGTAEIDELEPFYIVAYAEDTFGFMINGIYSGIQYYLFSNAELLRAWLVQINLAGKTNFIINIFTVPKLAFYGIDLSQDISQAIEQDIMAQRKVITLQSTPSNLDGYSPKNQKLRTYPYCYIGFAPQGSQGKIFRYEDFENGIPIFNMISEVNPNPQICVIPQNYRGVNGDNLQDTVSFGGYPTISWSNDVFNVWLAQNSQLINLRMENLRENTGFTQLRNLGSLGSNIGKALNKDLTGAISGTASSVLDIQQTNVNYQYEINKQLAEMEVQEKLPNTSTFGGNNTALIGYNIFDKQIFNRYTIKKEFAKCIDDYFDMYGYQTNELKIPNLNNRPNWNYIKTIGCNITGDIPQEDLQTIKNMFDNGVTLWHNKNTFLDYSQNNR